MTTLIFPAPEANNSDLATIMRALALDVGLAVPDQVVGSSERTWQEALDYVNRVGADLARRVDWGALTGNVTIQGTGAPGSTALPDDFSRLQRGVAVTFGGEIVRPLTNAEWRGITPAQGLPRYFLLEGNRISFYPFMSAAQTASVTYIKKTWCDGGEEFTADDQSSIFPDDLLEQALITHWRRQKGMDYADQEQEFEATLANYAGFDDRGRL